MYIRQTQQTHSDTEKTWRSNEST